MEGGLEKILCTWRWNDQSSAYQSSWIQSTLIELEENIKAMLTLIHQDDGNTFAQKAEMFYKKKPELVKMVENFQKLYHLVVEHCSQLSSPSSLSSTSSQQLENYHGVEGAIKLEWESSDSSPKSGVEDPELETNARNAFQLKSLRETANVFSSDGTDEMSSELSRRILPVENQPTVIEEKDVQKREDSTLSFSPNTFEGSEILFHTLEQQISHSKQILGLIEENCTHLNELRRRNEEKREANIELWSQIEKLRKENQILQEQHSKLMDENGAFHVKLQELMSSNSSTAKNKHHTSQFSWLKALLLSASHEGGFL